MGNSRPFAGAVLVRLILAALVASGQGHAWAGDSLSAINRAIDDRYEENVATARSIWEWAELGYLENKSSALLQEKLRDVGFDVATGVAGIPTAFVATWGKGGPVIGILAEFDALPGISQNDSPVRALREDTTSGHACGHHLFGTASVSAAIAISKWLKDTGTRGTIKVYGTPAEEGGSGKVYLVRDGQFGGVDTVLHWHPSSANSANIETNLANRSAKFRYYGISTHAAGAPASGRSALDGVEAMNAMVNLMREHVPQETRIHYVITAGGAAPNVVPDFAEVFYYVRHPDPAALEKIWDRVVNAARGAAMGTDTTMDFEIIHGNRNVLPNETLQRIIHAKLTETGGITYNEKEQAFAEKLYSTLISPQRVIGDQESIEPLKEDTSSGSTDVGDVSWVVPTGGLRVATWVPGTSGHSWQAIAAGGTTIGYKGMQTAAKVMAQSAIELYSNPDLVDQAKKELDERRGKDFVYKPLLGDRKPPLDFRKGAE
jgi:aminobenzoyl-glutamate utilization protein B